MLLGEKLSIPFDLYINSATKTTGLFDVRNIEGQNHSKHTVLYQSYENVKDGEIHDVTNFEVAEAPLSRIILADLTVKRKKICIWPITAQNWGRGHGPDFESQGKWL